MSVIKSIWSGVLKIYDFLLSMGLTNNQAILVILTLLVIALIVIFIIGMLRFFIFPLFQLGFAYLYDLTLTKKAFIKGKHHEAFAFDTNSMKNEITVVKSEKKYRAFIKQFFSQGQTVSFKNGSSYKVDMFQTVKKKNKKFSDWNKVTYVYHLSPVINNY